MSFKIALLFVFIIRILSIRCYQTAFRKNLFFSHEEDDIFQAAQKIAQHCFKENDKNRIILSLSQNSSDDVIIRKSLLAEISPINLFRICDKVFYENYKRNIDKFTLNETKLIQKTYQATSIIIITTSIEGFVAIIKAMSESIWWNHEAFFLIINRNVTNGCQLSNEFLAAIWSVNVLSALYLCNKWNNKLVVYTFNPYADIAPNLWQKIPKKNIFILGDTFGFYNFICDDLYFDKTRNLHGYNLKANIMNDGLTLRYDPTKTGYARFSGLTYDIMCTALDHINATISVKWTRPRSKVGLLDDLKKGTVDIRLYPSFSTLTYYSLRIQSYPPFNTRIKFLTLSKHVDIFLLYFDVKVWSLFTVISFFSIIALKYVEGRSMSRVILEFIRILTNSTFLSKPREIRKKFFLIMVVIAVIAMNSIMQGHLSSVHISPDRVPDVDTIKDLMKSNLTIYGPSMYREMLGPSGRKMRYQKSDYQIKDCFEMLKKGKHVACLITDIQIVLYDGPNIHISKGDWAERNLVYTFAKNSPLVRKFSQIFMKLNEAGIIKLFRNRDQNYMLKYRKYEVHEGVKSLNLNKLSFSFFILLGGWALGCFAFLFEIVILNKKVTFIQLRRECLKFK